MISAPVHGGRVSGPADEAFQFRYRQTDEQWDRWSHQTPEPTPRNRRDVETMSAGVLRKVERDRQHAPPRHVWSASLLFFTDTSVSPALEKSSYRMQADERSSRMPERCSGLRPRWRSRWSTAFRDTDGPLGVPKSYRAQAARGVTSCSSRSPIEARVVSRS